MTIALSEVEGLKFFALSALSRVHQLLDLFGLDRDISHEV